MTRPIRRIALNTGGGDAPGLNAVIRAIVLSALNRGWEVLGIRKGYEGLLDTSKITPLNRESVRGITHLGGTIIGTTDEWEDPRTWKGQAVGIRVSGHDAFHVVIFHVDPTSPLAVGDTVTAGQAIGTSAKRSGTAADVAFGVSTPTGHRLISFFEVMTDAVFEVYAGRGIESRQATIITQAERDADPLTCEGEEFAGPGNLQNMIDLQ